MSQNNGSNTATQKSRQPSKEKHHGQPLRDLAYFLKTSFQSIRDLNAVGTFLPCGGELKHRIVDPIEEIEGPRRILEIGPGTGPMSRAIHAALAPEDELVMVELLPRFAEHMEEWRQGLEAADRDRIKVVLGDYTEYEDEPFDYIICGAPLNVMPLPVVEKFFTAFKRHSKPEALIATYGYVGSGPFRKNMPGIRDQAKPTINYIEHQRKRAAVHVGRIFKHLPPLIYCYYRNSLLDVPTMA